MHSIIEVVNERLTENNKQKNKSKKLSKFKTWLMLVTHFQSFCLLGRVFGVMRHSCHSGLYHCLDVSSLLPQQVREIPIVIGRCFFVFCFFCISCFVENTFFVFESPNRTTIGLTLSEFCFPMYKNIICLYVVKDVLQADFLLLFFFPNVHIYQRSHNLPSDYFDQKMPDAMTVKDTHRHSSHLPTSFIPSSSGIY